VFLVRSEIVDGRTHVTALGELDLATRERLRAAVLAAFDAGLPVVVDLAGVGFIDSSGLQTVLELDQTARERRALLRVLPSQQVRRVLELTGLERLLTLDWDQSRRGAESDG
jgi:anti-anti-sigma factor